MIYYTACISEIGKEALTEENLIVLFRDNAPSDLRPYCVLHNGLEVIQTIQKGQTLIIGDEVFIIYAVGDLVNKNLHELGHITIYFNSHTMVDNPGDLCVNGNKPLVIQVGDIIQIKE
ncbi:MAG: PTS glucitol/sorbitol transporter subunit IIA [Brevinema sp.]